MKRIVFGFLFVLFAFNVNAKDLYESGLDKFQNAQSTISKSTLPNNDQTDAIIAEAKQLMPDEDWAKIDAMDGDKKLIYVRNLLAVKAYETLRKKWFDDFKAQVKKRNDIVWGVGDDTWKVYQRSSAKKFVINEHDDAELHCEKTCALYDVKYDDYFMIMEIQKPEDLKIEFQKTKKGAPQGRSLFCWCSCGNSNPGHLD